MNALRLKTLDRLPFNWRFVLVYSVYIGAAWVVWRMVR